MPACFRNLSPEAAAALSPLEDDIGLEVGDPDGYRMQCMMTRFRWYPVTVRARVKSVRDPRQRRRTRWMHVLEEPGVERAAWPTVFSDEGFCLAMGRETNLQRTEVGRQSLEAFMAGGDNFFDDFEPAGDIGAPDLEEDKHSIKRLFCVLGLSTKLNFAASEGK